MDRQKRVRVTDDGYFVFGIGRDRKFDVTITKELEKKKKQKVVKKIQENIKFKELMGFLKKGNSSKRSI